MVKKAKCQHCGEPLNEWFVKAVWWSRLKIERNFRGMFMWCFGGCNNISEFKNHADYRAYSYGRFLFI